MERRYPFLERIKEILDAKEKTLKWLAAEIDKSDRWFYNISDFSKLQFSDIEKISSVLEKNFLADFNNWRHDHEPSAYLLNEPGEVYKKEKPAKRVTIQLSLKASPTDIQSGLSDMIDLIRKEGEKRGFEIE